MKTLFGYLLFICCTLNVFAYDYLQIQHPQQTWRYGKGTIEQSMLSIKPKGVYFQYDLYLTISGKDLGFTAADSVEIQLEFGLPVEAMVNDLWLWMDDGSIMQGLILDRWTASNIYENIVKRRRDPALLLKNSSTQYSLKIYPMAGNSSRKIKVSYLLPMTMGANSVSAVIPTNILRTSKVFPGKMTTLFWPTAEISKPQFAEAKSAFEAVTRLDSATQKQYYYGELPSATFSNTVTLFATAFVNNNVFVAKYNDPTSSGSGYFQVSLNPAKVFGINTGQKIAFLFEFDEAKSAYSSTSFINSFKSFILSSMTSKDSFNLIFSGSQIKRVKQTGWIAGDSASIENVFSQISLNSILNADNMQALLTDGIDFVKMNGGNAALWLFAGTEKYGHYAVANPALASLKELLHPTIPIYVTDISNWSISYYYVNGRYYYGNDYFYENLTKTTGGLWTSYRTGSSLQSNFSLVLDQIRGTIQSFDMITRIETGFCSNRYMISGSTQASDITADKTITQIGKFNGQFPFIVELAGIYKGETLTTKISIAADQAYTGDSTIAVSWAGNYIAALESQPQSNSNTKLIIDLSLTNRILSKYTAFLALEPNDSLKACTTCRDESKLVSVGTRKETLVPSKDSLLFAYPNPFNPETRIKLKLPAGVHPSNASLRIFNVLGQVVKDVDITGSSDAAYTEIVWNGTNNEGKALASGIYFAVLATPQKVQSLKLMLMK